MRIGIDIRPLMEKRTTGVQVYGHNLLRALFELDRENQYLLFVNSFRNVRDTLPKFDYPNVELCIFRYPNKLFMFSQVFLGFPRVDRMLGGVDLFFSPHWRVTALSESAPLVLTVHDLSFEVVYEFFTVRRRLWHKFMSLRSAAQRADKLIAVSERTKQDLQEIYKVPREKIKVIYPGVRPLPRGTGEAEGYFLYFGTFEPRKNIESVLAAYEQYYKTSHVKRPLVLAGSSGWKTKLKLPRKVRIIRDVTEQQKLKFYQDAYALLFLSFYEGFGFPVLEAASCGVPVISSFATSLSEIGHEFALLVNPFRPSQIAQAMLELEQDKALYGELKHKGRAAAIRFSWEKTAEETLELFKQNAHRY